MRDPEGLRALASPVRQAILHDLARLGRATVRELAASSGRSESSLHHHLRALERAGAVGVVGARPTGRRPEVVWSARASRVQMEPSARSSEAVDCARRVARSMLREAERDLGAALASTSSVRSGPGRNVLGVGARVQLDRNALRLLNRLANELERLLEGSRGERRVGSRRRASQALTVAFVLAPARRRRP